MKEICKNCTHCKPTYKGQLCEKTGKKVKQKDTCEDWHQKGWRMSTQVEIEAKKADKLLQPVYKWAASTTPYIALAAVPTLFDIICEIHGLSKADEWREIGRSIKKVDEELGPAIEVEG